VNFESHSEKVRHNTFRKELCTRKCPIFFTPGAEHTADFLQKFVKNAVNDRFLFEYIEDLDREQYEDVIEGDIEEGDDEHEVDEHEVEEHEGEEHEGEEHEGEEHEGEEHEGEEHEGEEEDKIKKNREKNKRIVSMVRGTIAFFNKFDSSEQIDWEIMFSDNSSSSSSSSEFSFYHLLAFIKNLYLVQHDADIPMLMALVWSVFIIKPNYYGNEMPLPKNFFIYTNYDNCKNIVAPLILTAELTSYEDLKNKCWVKPKLSVVTTTTRRRRRKKVIVAADDQEKIKQLQAQLQALAKENREIRAKKREEGTRTASRINTRSKTTQQAKDSNNDERSGEEEDSNDQSGEEEDSNDQQSENNDETNVINADFNADDDDDSDYSDERLSSIIGKEDLNDQQSETIETNNINADFNAEDVSTNDDDSGERLSSIIELHNHENKNCTTQKINEMIAEIFHSIDLPDFACFFSSHILLTEILLYVIGKSVVRTNYIVYDGRIITLDVKMHFWTFFQETAAEKKQLRKVSLVDLGDFNVNYVFNAGSITDQIQYVRVSDLVVNYSGEDEYKRLFISLYNLDKILIVDTKHDAEELWNIKDHTYCVLTLDGFRKNRKGIIKFGKAFKKYQY
jgi:hypothetical protein